MPESFERDKSPDYKGPVNSDGKSVYGHRNAEVVIEARRRRLYKHLNNGQSLRANVFAHAERESISITTAWRDAKAINEWYKEDFEAERETMVARLTSLRWRAIEGAMRSKNWASAAQLMDSLSRTCGDGSEFQQSEDVKLNISIEPPQK